MKGRCYFLFASLLGAIVLLLAACGGSTSGLSSSSSEQTNSQQPSGPSIVGMWSGNCATFNDSFNTTDFRDDGTVLLANNQVATYSVNGNQIQLSAGGYTVEYSYELSQSSNILKLSDVKIFFCSLGRAGSAAENETRQALLGTWTMSGQFCQSVYYLSGFSGLDFKTTRQLM